MTWKGWAALSAAALWFLGRMGVAKAQGQAPESVAAPGTLGARALDVARTQVGVRETTNQNDGPQIARYFEGCTRLVNGKEAPTGWSPGWEWCAAFASWCGYQAAQEGERPPHGRRIAVWELVRDAREQGRFEDVASWGDGPKPGDLVVWKRGGDPRIPGQFGHVSRCVSWNGEKLETVGGNENHSVRLADVTHDLPRAVGVIRY